MYFCGTIDLRIGGDCRLIIGYARLSNVEQANGNTLEQQVDRLYAAGAEKVFVDLESGWRGKKRPQLEQVLKLVRSGKVSQVIVTRIDRLSRRGSQSFKLFDEFVDRGVTLKALDEPFDLATPAGKMTAGLLAVFAQHHSDLKSQSVKHGWNHLRKNKIPVNPPFGYKKINNCLEFDVEPFLCLEGKELSKYEIAQDLIETFFKERSLQGTVRAINLKYGIFTPSHGKKGLAARGLFRFSLTGFIDWITSPVLRGHLSYLGGKEIYYNVHDKILISEEQYRLIEIIRQDNRKRSGFCASGRKYPLSGLIYCAECRHCCYSLSGGRGKNIPGRNYYYQCQRWRTRGCSNRKVIRMEALEESLISYLTTKAVEIEQFDRQTDFASQQKPQELLELEEQLKGLERLGSNPAIEAAKKALQNQIENLSNYLSINTSNCVSLNRTLIEAFANPSFWRSQEPEQKRLIYRLLVDKISIRDGKIESITLKI